MKANQSAVNALAALIGPDLTQNICGCSPATQRIAAALAVIVRFGGIDGAHHKAWVLDQAVRALAGEHYAALVAAARDGEDGPETYDWNVGVAP